MSVRQGHVLIAKKINGVSEAPSATVFGYFNVTTFQANNFGLQISRASVAFSVPKTWLESQGFTKEQVVLLMQQDGEWEELDAVVSTRVTKR